MKLFLLIGSAYGLLGVVLGAFGAHALKARLTPDLLAVWKTAVEYQFYHAFALLLVGFWLRAQAHPALNVAGVCFTLGVILFSGSLYALVLSGVRGLGAVTPLGGLLFIIGWIALGLAALRSA